MYKTIVQNYKRELNETYNELHEYKVIKDEGQGCIQTFIDCLEDSDDDLLYFEDDAILCKDFEKTFQDVLNNLGKDKLIQLFSSLLCKILQSVCNFNKILAVCCLEQRLGKSYELLPVNKPSLVCNLLNA